MLFERLLTAGSKKNSAHRRVRSFSERGDVDTAIDSGPVLTTVLQLIRQADSRLSVESAQTIEEQLAPLTARDEDRFSRSCDWSGVCLHRLSPYPNSTLRCCAAGSDHTGIRPRHIP